MVSTVKDLTQTLSELGITLSGFTGIRFMNFSGSNLVAIDFVFSSTLYYRLCMGINTNKEIFMERNQNGSVTRIWTGTVR